MERVWIRFSFFLPLLITALGCQQTSDRYHSGKYTMQIHQKPFGSTQDGEEVTLFQLINANGIQADIINYGGIVTALRVPDKNGHLGDIVLGYNDLAFYIENSPYFGALIGRYGNRIARGQFTLGGKTYKLAVNNNGNHLHGGMIGFDKKVWKAEPIEVENAVGVKLSLLSPDGDEGYPGTLDCHVTYLLTNDDELKIVYRALTDKPTVVNLTHHSYFNLTGSQRDILDHQLMIQSDRFTPVDKTLIPTGKLQSVKNTPFDFTEPVAIGARIEEDHPQLINGAGYDHNFVLNNQSGDLTLAARVFEPESGRIMEVLTTEPGLQFYSGNFLDGSITGKEGVPYGHRWGFCLEAQHYPDSPNNPQFPSVILRPGEAYSQTTVYRFSVRR